MYNDRRVLLGAWATTILQDAGVFQVECLQRAFLRRAQHV